MAKQLKLRRGTTSQHSSFTGAEGECTVDTTKDTLVVHDGSQAGGRPLLREDLSNIGTGVITAAMLGSNSVDSSELVDGSVDHSHLAGDCVDGDNIQDDAINAEHIGTLSTHLQLADSSELRLGTSDDLKLYHDATNSTITNTTGDLYITDSGGNIYIQAKAGEQSITAFADGQVKLYYDNAEKLASTTDGINLTGDLDLSGGVKIGSTDHYLYQDSATRVSLRVGDPSGSHTYGSFANRSGVFAVGCPSGHVQIEVGNESTPDIAAKFNNNGSVELNHDGIKRLETKSTGVDLHGATVHWSNQGGDTHLEIGAYANSNQNSYIDLIGDSTYSDYGLRILRGNAGANTSSHIKHRGTGVFQIGSQDGGKVCFGGYADGYAFDNVSYAAVQITSAGVASLATRQNGTLAQSALSFFNPNGRVGYISTSGSSTGYHTSSDYRLKENAVAISDGITRLKTLKPYRFNFKTDASVTVDGFFAHEVTAVPEAITGTKDETHDLTYVESDNIPEGKKVGDVKEANAPLYQCIDQSKIVPLLTAALQEAIAKIETLETKVAALEG